MGKKVAGAEKLQHNWTSDAYAEAVVTASEVEVEKYMDEEAELVEKALRVQAEIDAVVQHFTAEDVVRPIVDQAASEGLFQAVLAEFKGGDVLEELGLTMCFLFLLLGSRHKETTENLKAYGVKMYALQRMKAILRPFKISHEYDAIDNANKIIISWD